MEYFYKAFISYRHDTHDIKTATEIQNLLERYPVPGSIRKEHGIKSIGRIFRDKDELPSTSDLNDTIKEAISSSEYLICICSPAYMESEWCRKELEFFLESHDKANVLTVLADGDPYEVIPKILRTETVTTTDELGKEVTREISLEPLSCDWRLDRHTARTEELPRLAAALIGCRYADLRQKLRRRQMRIFAIAAAAGMVLLMYFVWSYMRIQRNYRQALINQSHYLAASAREALEGNDNLLAAQLSLAALPDEHTDRPIVPEALYTLSKAVGAYEPKRDDNFQSTESYEMSSGGLYQYEVSPDAGNLVMTDGGGKIAIWDLCADSQVAELTFSDLFGTEWGSLTGHGNEQFILFGYHDLALLSYSDASVVWHQKFDGLIRNVIALGEGKEAPLMVLVDYSGSYNKSTEELIILSAESGEVTDQLNIGEISGGQALHCYKETYYSSDISLCAVCPEAECVVTAAGNPREDEKDRTDIAGFLTYFYNTGETVWTPFAAAPYRASGLSRDQSGRILLTYAEQEEDYVANTRQTASYNSASIYSYYETGRETIVLLQEKTGELLWKNILAYQGNRISRRFLEAPYFCQDLRVMKGDGEHPDREFALAATSNVFALYDIDTGETVREVILTDLIVSVDLQDEEEGILGINGYSGTHYTTRYFDDNCIAMNYMAGGAEDAVFVRERDAKSGQSQFLLRQEDTIRLFKGGNGDEDWSSFGFEISQTGFWDHFFCGSKLLLYDSWNGLFAYDLADGSALWETNPGDGIDYAIAGCSADGKYVYLKSRYPWGDQEKDFLLRVSVEDGTSEQVSLIGDEVPEGAEQWAFNTENAIISGSYIYYRATDYSSSFWCRFSMNDESILRLKMPFNSNDQWSINNDRYIFASDGSGGTVFEDDAGYLLNFKTQTVTQLKNPFPTPNKGAYDDASGMFAVWNEEEKVIHVCKADGTEIRAISDITERITLLWFYKGDLYAATDKRFLYRWRGKDGRAYGALETSVGIGKGADVTTPAEDGTLIIDSGAGDLVMIDLDHWAVTAEAADVLGYSRETRQIINIAEEGDRYVLGAFPYYTPQELIQKGKRFVGDRTLSEKENSRYGLE